MIDCVHLGEKFLYGWSRLGRRSAKAEVAEVPIIDN